MDYNVTASLTNLSSQGNSYTFTGGGELAGGDVQGSLVGATGQAPLFSDLRWRYALRENDYFSSFTAGQIPTGSEFVPRVQGIVLSNEPVEPRVMFDNYVVDGYTDPESDVELYLNDRLIDFQKTNAAGYYRFQFPLTYGTVRIVVKTYSKYGDINVDEKQVQVPFTFVPQGVLSYDLQAGKADRNVALANDVYFGNANLLMVQLTGSRSKEVSSAVITAASGSRSMMPDSCQGFFPIHRERGRRTGCVLPHDANALFASNAGVFAQYAKYLMTDSILGLSPQQTASLALYLPLSFVSTGTGFRISEDYADAASVKRLSTRFDLSTRLTGVQLLTSYREVMTGSNLNQLGLTGNGFSATAMYAIPRGSSLPDFLQAFLLRGVATYDLQGKTFQDASFQISKTFLQIFQFNLGFDTPAVQVHLAAGRPDHDPNFTRDVFDL